MAPPRTVTLPTQEELRKLFHYEAKTGRIFWKARPGVTGWNTRYAGKEAFLCLTNGHKRGMLFRNSVYAHRVIWKMVTGEDPPEIDHIDGNPLNNSWRNLRVAVGGANQKNCELRNDNKSGHVGVVRRGDRWIAQIGVNGTTKHIGIYDSVGLAIAARKRAQEEYGFHPRHGRAPWKGT